MTIATRRRFRLAAAAVVGVAAGLIWASAEAQEKPTEARKLFDEVAATYQKLDSYADEGKFSASLSINGKAQKESSTMSLVFARPGKIKVDLGEVKLVGDGKTLTTVVDPFKKYVEDEAPAALTMDTLKDGQVGALLFGGPAGTSLGTILQMLISEDPAKALLEGTEGLKLEEDRKGEGGALRVLLIDKAQSPDLRLVIEPKTKLVRAIELAFDPKDLIAGAPKGTKITIDEFGWKAGAIETGKPAADVFTASPPKGFEKVETIAEAFGRDQSGAEKLAGKPAPDFTMTVLDGDKTRPLSKSDLAGKVVMIDFWATWCGPCLKELPEVQQMVKALADQKKDVKVIALSIDENPGDVKEMRKLVEDTLKQRKIDLTGNSVGLIALDTDKSIAQAYQVEGIPMIVLLDGQGVVQKVHVGYTERDVLEGEINDLLAGKSLVKPKSAKADAAASAKPKD